MSPLFKAEDRSSAIERRDQAIHRGIEKERIESDAKTVRLRALRLEKEAADRAEALLKAPVAPAKKTKKLV